MTAALTNAVTSPLTRFHPEGDQAQGLRRMFAHAGVRHLPVLSNPHVAFGGVLLERLCVAFAGHRRHVLVVDASESAPMPSELAPVDLGACIEPLSAHVSYLAARGLPLRYVDHNGSTAGLLQACADACPQAQVIVVHAPASDLARLFVRRRVTPLLLCDDQAESVTHAYAGLKWLAQRAGLLVHDLLLGAPPQSLRAERIALQLATCADDFLGAVVRQWVQVDPASDPLEPASPALHAWAARLWQPPTGEGDVEGTDLRDVRGGYALSSPAPLQ